MNRDIVIANIMAIVVLGLAFWWFFGFDVKSFWNGEAHPTIFVREGSYQPSLVQISAGKPIELRFIRQDPAMCAGSVFFPELKLAYMLPMNEAITIPLPPLPAGEITFTCQFGTTYQGKIIVA